MADDKIKLSGMTEATDTQMTDNAIMQVAVTEQNSSTGFLTRKSTLARLANYILNKHDLVNLAGLTQTVKSAFQSVLDKITGIAETIGDEPMGTTATTVTGAIAEHETDIAALNSNLEVESSGQITSSASNVTTSSANIIFYRIGKLGLLYYSLKWDSITANTEYTICNISAYGNPTTKFNYTVSNQAGNPFLVQVYANGNISFYANGHSDIGFVRGVLAFPLV